MHDHKSLPQWLKLSLGVVLLVLLVVLSLRQMFDLQTKAQSMHVSATATMLVTPDVATVRVGVLSEGNDQTIVLNQTTQKTNQVIAFIKQQGIDARDIKTTEFSLTPKYQYHDGQNTLAGYQASQTIMIQIKQVDRSTAMLTALLSGVTSNGANQIQGITFSFAHDAEIEQKLRKQAIEQARQKAQQIANDASLTLGKVTNVILSSPSPSAVRQAHAPLSFAKANTVMPNIEPGEQEITETITLVFDVFQDR